MAGFQAKAGGEMGGPDEEQDALVIFGFVKDSRGAPVNDANVTAAVQKSITFSVCTGSTGAYRFPLFNKSVNPADVVLACEKQGYKQVRVTRRPPVTSPEGQVRVETECRLERG